MPSQADVFRIDPVTNRTYHYWHVFVPGIRAGQLYGYRFDGPFDPTIGMRFDPGKLLLDPYGRAVWSLKHTVEPLRVDAATILQPR